MLPELGIKRLPGRVHRGCAFRELDGLEPPLLRIASYRRNFILIEFLNALHEEKMGRRGVAIRDGFMEVSRQLRVSTLYIGAIERAMTATICNVVIITRGGGRVAFLKSSQDLAIQTGGCFEHACLPLGGSLSRFLRQKRPHRFCAAPKSMFRHPLGRALPSIT